MINLNLISQFLNTAKKTGATIDEIAPVSNVLCDALIKNCAGSKNILLSEPQFISPHLFKDFRDYISASHYNAEQLASAEIGITDAFAGISSTGTVCISISSSLSSYISLLPRKHIVVLDSYYIFERPRDIFKQFILRSSAEEKGWIFISGPSATADMGELVRGVHGPDKLHIILLGQQ